MTEFYGRPDYAMTQLMLKREVVHFEKSDQTLSKIEDINNRISKMTNFLAELSKHTEDSMRVDWKGNPEKMRLVDEARAAYPQLIEPGVYSWENSKLIKAQVEMINNHINGTLSPQLPYQTSVLTQEQYEFNQILEIVTNANKTWSNFIDRILANIQRAKQ